VMANAKCRSCQAPIRWVLLASTDRRAPINPEADPDGNMYVHHWEGDMPVMEVAASRAAVPRNVPLAYKSHFATCKDAATWRKM
jgi:hypothetical protein